MIPPETLEAIRSATSLPEIVSEYATLRRVPGAYVARCPLHSEKTASFRINMGDRAGHFYCFGCHAHGNIFDFVMKVTGGTFYRTALELAQRAGIPLDNQPRQSYLQIAADREDREAAIWWWQRRWQDIRAELDCNSHAEMPAVQLIWSDDGTQKIIAAPMSEEYAWSCTLGRLLQRIEGMPFLEKKQMFLDMETGRDRREFRAWRDGERALEGLRVQDWARDVLARNLERSRAGGFKDPDDFIQKFGGAAYLAAVDGAVGLARS